MNSVFARKRGLALGITVGGIGMAAMVLPPALHWAIASWGWRGGYQFLALMTLVPVPFVYFGMASADVTKNAVRAVTSGSHLRSRTFWTLVTSFAGIGAAVAALTIHITPLLQDRGMSSAAAAGVASLTGLGILVGRVGIGFIIDFLFAPYVAAIVFIAAGVGTFLLAQAGLGWAPLAAILVGLALGAELDLISYLTAKYFGVASYGFYYSLIYATFAIFGAIGPAMTGYLYDTLSSYTVALYGMTFLLIVGAAAMLSLPRFPEEASSVNV